MCKDWVGQGQTDRVFVRVVTNGIAVAPLVELERFCPMQSFCVPKDYLVVVVYLLCLLTLFFEGHHTSFVIAHSNHESKVCIVLVNMRRA